MKNPTTSAARRAPSRSRSRRTGRPVPEDDSIQRLVALVGSFAGCRVAVIGDLVADEFVYGDIARVSREAPVLILNHRKTVVTPGGGGNAVANLRALGAEPVPVGIVGRDEPGKMLLEEFERLGVETSGILVRNDYSTPTKSRILAGGVHTRRQQVVRIDRGAPRTKLPLSAERALDRALKTALRGADGLLVADYGYGCATPDRFEKTRTGANASLPATVDSRSRVTEYRGASACTPNQEELELALGLGPLADDQVESAGRRLLRRTAGQAVLVTRGAKGMCLFARGKSPEHVPAFGTDEVADVTGAGDTVIATFTLGLLAGASFIDAARLSNYAAGLVVMKAGTATLGPDELMGAIAEDHAR